MLELKGVGVSVAGKPILEDINLCVKSGEVMVLFGPNGSGKSTLLKAIMGFEGYDLVRGTVSFKGTVLNNLPIEQRVRQGLGIMYQHPPRIRGVRLGQMASFLNTDERRVEEAARQLSLADFLSRDLNLGFSGGEMKRSELFQLLLQNPDLLLLDEPESGVDLENISIMGQVLNSFLSQPGKSAFVITHTGYILDYLQAKTGCVMIKGRFWCVGDPRDMFREIRAAGYEKCRDCYVRNAV